MALPLMRYFSKVPESGDPSAANALLGAPSTTLESWCAQLAAAAGPVEPMVAPRPLHG